MLYISFDEIDGSITACDGTRYLVSFGFEKYDTIYNIQLLYPITS